MTAFQFYLSGAGSGVFLQRQYTHDMKVLKGYHVTGKQQNAYYGSHCQTVQSIPLMN